MNPNQRKTVLAILEEVLSVELSERQSFLRRKGLSEEVLNEVESLLALESESEGFMSLSAKDITEGFLPAEELKETSLIGQKIGIYEIEREIGFGGMGAVYLAKRDDDKFEQRVAIKMLRREFNIETIRKSFKREREIQAALVHPNIATLLDAGTTKDGIPFLVMEYVEGRPLDKYCSENKLTLNERLKLFNKVCEAVSFAHQNLIIHRDLKPSNIIVTKKGNLKLLDFGISKLIDSETDSGKTPTNFGAMTPDYASPEQISGKPVTTSTDIYSLGVVLFKILTGKIPFENRDKTDAKKLSEIHNSQPITPSVATSMNSDSFIGEKQLKGDIDNIVLKSLSKELERRYQTVEQMSADIWRFIDGLPVTARPATLAYRTRKFYERNRISVLAGVFVVLSLITGIAIAFWQANLAKKQANIAVENKRLAEIQTEKSLTEQKKSEKISKFMFRVISYGNPFWYAEGAKYDGNAKVLDVLEDLSGKIDDEFKEELDIRAELHHRFGEVFSAVAQNVSDTKKKKELMDKAKFHTLKALEHRKQFYGEKHELVAKDIFYSYRHLADSEEERAKILWNAVKMMRETNPKNRNLPFMLEVFFTSIVYPDGNGLDDIYYNAIVPKTGETKYEIAERFSSEKLDLIRFHYGKDSFAAIYVECSHARILAKLGKWGKFDKYFQGCKRDTSLLTTKNKQQISKNIQEIEKLRKRRD